jgi:hypothetical protein
MLLGGVSVRMSVMGGKATFHRRESSDVVAPIPVIRLTKKERSTVQPRLSLSNEHMERERGYKARMFGWLQRWPD